MVPLTHFRQFGFADVAAAGMQPFDAWLAEARRITGEDRPYGLFADPAEAYPWAKALWVLVFPYAAFEKYPPDCMQIPGYNFSSHACYGALDALAKSLQSFGIRAERATLLPHKSIALRTGKGHYGKNGLFYWPPYGSRVVLGVLVVDSDALTSAAFPTDPQKTTASGTDAVGSTCGAERISDADGTSNACGTCNGNASADTARNANAASNADTACTTYAACGACDRCAKACPTGALDGTGVVGPNCLRHFFPDPLPAHLKEKMGLRGIGCDTCQLVCPQNPRQTAPLPADYAELFHIPTLRQASEEQLKQLCARMAPFIGTNLARPAKIRGAAMGCTLK